MMEKTIAYIEGSTRTLEKEMAAGMSNKTANRRARQESLNLEKLLKQFRKDSLAYDKR